MLLFSYNKNLVANNINISLFGFILQYKLVSKYCKAHPSKYILFPAFNSLFISLSYISSRLLDKYSTKQPGEIWSPRTEKRKDKIIELNRKYRLFDGINSEYFHLQGTQKDRAKYIIKEINFKKVCGRCSSEQIIVLICYYVFN